MGLLDIVTNGVAIANAATADLQPQVAYRKFISVSGNGTVSRAVAVNTPALITKKQKLVRTADGKMLMSQAEVVFLDPSVVIHLLDGITLPDGTTGPILNFVGFVSRGTGNPFLTEVYL